MKTREPFPQAGDGIVTNFGKKRGVVRRRITRGLNADLDGNPNTRPDDLIAVEADFREGGKVVPREVNAAFFRQETFLEHLTRPSGFGRMAWPLFAFPQAVFIGAAIASPSNWWMSAICFAVVNGVLTLGAWMNYTRRWQ
jgi:hypothetical protein